MNIVTISQMIGVHKLNQLDEGPLIVRRFNEKVDAPHAIDLDYSGDQIYARYSELPADVRLAVSDYDIIDNNEAVRIATDLITLTKHAQAIAEKDDSMKNGMFGTIGFIACALSLGMIGFYLIQLNSTTGINETALTHFVVGIIKNFSGSP